MEQEVLNNLTDMIMETYVAEAMALRIQKMEFIKIAELSGIYRKMLDVFVYDAADKIKKPALDAINSFADSTNLIKYKNAIVTLTNVADINVTDARRTIAGKLIEDNCYKF